MNSEERGKGHMYDVWALKRPARVQDDSIFKSIDLLMEAFQTDDNYAKQ